VIYERNPSFGDAIEIVKIIDKKLTIGELKQIAVATFGNMVKAVVDVDREIIALDAELHSDLEALLLEDGSKQKNIWGINLYPDMHDEEFIEFDSLINIRPSQGNRSRGVEKEKIRNKIISIVRKRIR
jgi:hypothetical protein